MNTPVDIVSIGSAVVDVILKSSQFKPHSIDGDVVLCEIYGGKEDVEEAAFVSGGAGTNTAVAFARQGLTAAVVAEVGQDTLAQIIVDELESEKVNTSLLIEEPSEQTGISAVLVSSEGARSAMTFRGASKMLTPSDIPFDILKTVPWIHLSSIGNSELIRQIFLFCRDNSISLSWNPGVNESIDIVKNSVGDFERCCKVVFLNELEFAAVEDYKEFLFSLSEIVVVTRGKKGGEIYHAGKKTEYQGKTVPVVCELGAGDAFASGFVGALYKNLPLDQAITQGLENGASVVGHMSAKKGLLSFS